MRVWGITDKGIARQQNQDSYCFALLDAGRAIGVVCDGMGGAKAGHVASKIAVDAFLGWMREHIGTVEESQIPELMQEAVSLANTLVYSQARENEAFRGMGTTLVAVAVIGDRAVIVNVGDSRAYLVREGSIERLTRDHSVVEDMIDRGDITREEAKSHPKKNLITRALGADVKVRSDVFSTTLAEQDCLLLCSDGLVNTVSSQEILYEILHGGPLEDCCQRLLNISLSRGAPDNVTILLLQNC